jgi:iron complex transport system ATP-binding protein
MIQASDISFQYGKRKILENINLNLSSGELITLLGRNGEGKSTLFKILTGELRPDSGVVLLKKKEIHAMTGIELAQNRSVLPQESLINFPLRVFVVVEMGRSPYKKNKFEDKQHIYQSMQLTDITHLEYRFYSELSGGEKKRVQIARVLCQLQKDHDNDIIRKHSTKRNLEFNKGALFLDEPVNALDVLLQHKIMKILRHLADIGYSIFCILHDWNLAGLYSDRVLVLQNGKIHSDGTPKKVIRKDILEDVFGIQANIFQHSSARVGGYSESISL